MKDIYWCHLCLTTRVLLYPSPNHEGHIHFAKTFATARANLRRSHKLYTFLINIYASPFVALSVCAMFVLSILLVAKRELSISNLAETLGALARRLVLKLGQISRSRRPQYHVSWKSLFFSEELKNWIFADLFISYIADKRTKIETHILWAML